MVCRSRPIQVGLPYLSSVFTPTGDSIVSVIAKTGREKIMNATIPIIRYGVQDILDSVFKCMYTGIEILVCY